VKVQTKLGTPRANNADFGSQQGRHRIVALEDRGESILYDHGDFHVRTVLFEDLDGRSGENAVPERAQANDRHAGPIREAL
jgi:hypothetical protein